MKRTQFLTTLAAGALLAIGLCTAHAQTTTAPRSKLVLQVSDADPAKWNLALNNAKNVQDELGGANVDIEVVAYGPGIGMLKADATTANRVADAAKAGVKVLACENTMRNQKIARDDMQSAVGFVAAGVTHIMKRQTEGWAYVRP